MSDVARGVAARDACASCSSSLGYRTGCAVFVPITWLQDKYHKQINKLIKYIYTTDRWYYVNEKTTLTPQPETPV